MYQLIIFDKNGKKCPFFKTDDFEEMQRVAQDFSRWYTVSVEEVEDENK